MSHTRTMRARALIRLASMALALGGPEASPAQAPEHTLARAEQRAAPGTARDGGDALTLGALYARVDRGTPRVVAARLIADAATARIPGARRPPDPQFQFGLMNYRLPALAPMPVLGMQQLQLMQVLPVAGKLRLSGRVAEALALSARARAVEVRWEQRSRVAMAFYDLYQADRAVSIANDTKRLVQDIAATAQSMYAVGEGRQPDVLRARVEVARMSEEVIRRSAMRAAMAARLRGLLDDPIDTAMVTAALPRLPEALPALDTLLREAESNRAMIRAGESDLAAATDAERLARREIWPDLQVGVQYGQQRGAMGTDRMGSLTVGASLPIFARDRQLQTRTEAAAMRAMARADLSAMRAETRSRVAELYAECLRARNLRALYRTTILPQAETAVASSLSAYRVGSVNLMTLLDNQMTVNRYRQELFVLDAELGKAIAELEMLTGRELFDANTRASRGTE